MTEQPAPEGLGSIGPYRLVRRLGSGGMGVVYLATTVGGRLVAVKVIRQDLAADEGFRARFSREVALARMVSGFYTAPVVDADTEGPQPWLATAYVAGPSLADLVARHGLLPVGSVITLAGGLAEALQSIHAAGLVHRDLKPANVLLAADGPRVIDFGVSQALTGTRLTAAGVIVGSPGFMSPEQASDGPVGPASDVFSLGAVLAFAATGREPFGSGPLHALLYRVVNEEPDLSAVPDQIRPLIAACLAKDPARRPAPGQALAAIQELSPGGFAGWLPTRIEDGPAGPEAVSSGYSRDPAADWELGPAGQPGTVTLAPAPDITPRAHRAGRGGRPRWRAAAIATGLLAAAGAALALTLSLAHGDSPTTSTGTGPHTTAPPLATTCQGDGSGCTRPGSYGPVDALVSADYHGLKIVWASASVVGTAAGYPTYWTAYLTFTDVGSTTEPFSCSLAAHVWMHATGGKGDDGYLQAGQTTCSADSGLTASLSPGQSFQFYATFHNVPWPGSRVAIWLQDINASSAGIYPFT